MILKKLLLFNILLLSRGLNGCEIMPDLCKDFDCSVQLTTHTVQSINVSSTLQHNVIDNTFVHSTKFFFWGPIIDSQHNLTIVITISNIKDDMCKNLNCWMRVRPNSYYNFKDQDFDGYYNFTDNKLIFHSSFIFSYNNMYDDYTTNIQSCITRTSSEGHCFTGINNYKYDILKPFHLFNKI